MDGIRLSPPPPIPCIYKTFISYVSHSGLVKPARPSGLSRSDWGLNTEWRGFASPFCFQKGRQTFLKATQALCPPKPKESLRPRLTSALTALFGV